MNYRNNRLLTKIILIIIIGFTSCKDSTTTPDPEPTKTLNKTTLLDKIWYNQGGSIKHEFKTNGTYRFDGTWNWVNNSDTMEIVITSGDPKTYWKIYWNTETEMSCEKVGSGGALLYKDQPW